MIEHELNKWLNVCALALKGKSPSELSGELAAVWLAVLDRNGVREADLGPVFSSIVEHETFFPAPAEFLKRWRRHVEATRPAFVLKDPVTVGVSDIGVHTLAERESADPASVIESPSVPVLPVTDEQRKAAMARIDRLAEAKAV